MRFANEDQLGNASSRKNLPPLRRRLPSETALQPAAQASGLTAGWKRARQVSMPLPTPVQVISDEEQKKLEDLEMQLPRVAGRIDPILLIVTLALVCVGLVMIYSASSFIAARYFGDASYYFQRHLMWSLLGITAMLVTMRIDYRHWRRVSMIGLMITLPLLVLVLIFGTPIYGASRWFTLGNFFSIQPSEIAKLVLALYIADWLARKGNQVGTFVYGLAPFVILVGVVLGLVLLENDMGTAVIIAGLATAMFFTAGANIFQFLLAAACGGLIFLTQAFQGYRYLRVLGFMDPFKDTTGKNLQLYQSLLALGSGGWFGLGLGASRQKTGYLPLPYIDSIFAIIGEELGFIGSALVVMLFVFLAFRGFRLARRARDVYGALLATGITTWLVLQAIINIAATTGSIPYTGVPLPFITYGGTSLVITLAAVGILLNISRYIQTPELPALSKRSITMTLKLRRNQAEEAVV
jgi:cell division protein FtsW